jgi:NAD-dependent deacetylase sirtuin 4
MSSPSHDDAHRIAEAIAQGRVVALTGAGMSTDSGIPDYRGPATRDRPRKPVQHRDFIRDPAVRQRYWARAFVGWQRFTAAKPNRCHEALAVLEQRGVVTSVITQNVDRLHQAAGSRSVVELHGALAEVRCLDCGAIEPREELQARLAALNPAAAGATAAFAPDGDADLAGEIVETFVVAPCVACGGVLKPNVVFFGDNVARPIVDDAFARVEASRVLLVLGTSLTVFSGFRFVRRAHELGVPIVLVNQGETRGDPLATVRVDAPLGDVLPAAAERLSLE